MATYHAWYSPKQEQIRRESRPCRCIHDVKYNDCKFTSMSIANRTPGCIYWSDSAGHKYEITMVSKTKEHGCNTKYLDDLEYRGTVIKYEGVCRW